MSDQHYFPPLNGKVDCSQCKAPGCWCRDKYQRDRRDFTHASWGPAPRCATCRYMEISGQAGHTGNNSHLRRPRGTCRCRQPDAQAAFQLICPDSSRMPGFIAFTKGAMDEPDIRTAPRWCPLKLLLRPVEVDSQAAHRIIETYRPKGMFYLTENSDRYIGIDNRTGDAWCEEFSSKRKCLDWLQGWGPAQAAEW